MTLQTFNFIYFDHLVSFLSFFSFSFFLFFGLESLCLDPFSFPEQESKTLRILDVHKYCYQLPKANFEMLELLIGHLKR